MVSFARRDAREPGFVCSCSDAVDKVNLTETRNSLAISTSAMAPPPKHHAHRR